MGESSQVDPLLLQRMVGRFIESTAEPTVESLQAELAAARVALSPAATLSLLSKVQQSLHGYGELQQLITVGVTDVLVNGPESVWTDSEVGLRLSDLKFKDELAVRRIAMRLAAVAGRRLDDSQPYVDALLPDGVRLQAALPPVAISGTQISLRMPATSPFSLLHWQLGLTAEQSEKLDQLSAGQTSFVVSGLTGAGKTSLLRSLLNCFPDNRRIVVLEDVAELNLKLPNLVSLQGRAINAEGFGEIPLATLVRHSLRMRPDAIVIGEVRGPEVLDWLLAVSAGHGGSATTVHANSVKHAVARLLLLSELAGITRSVANQIIVDAQLTFIHCARTVNGRRIVQIESQALV